MPMKSLEALHDYAIVFWTKAESGDAESPRAYVLEKVKYHVDVEAIDFSSIRQGLS